MTSAKTETVTKTAPDRARQRARAATVGTAHAAEQPLLRPHWHDNTHHTRSTQRAIRVPCKMQSTNHAPLHSHMHRFVIVAAIVALVTGAGITSLQTVPAKLYVPLGHTAEGGLAVAEPAGHAYPALHGVHAPHADPQYLPVRVRNSGVQYSEQGKTTTRNTPRHSAGTITKTRGVIRGHGDGIRGELVGVQVNADTPAGQVVHVVAPVTGVQPSVRLVSVVLLCFRCGTRGQAG